jgi:hypothetical protein
VSDHGEWKQRGESVAASGTEFICPFCGGRAMAMDEPQGVMHHMPPCETFLALDPLAFLQAVNRWKAKEN